MTFKLSEEEEYHIEEKKKDYETVGEVRCSILWESQNCMLGGLENRELNICLCLPGHWLLPLCFERVALLHAQQKQLMG